MIFARRRGLDRAIYDSWRRALPNAETTAGQLLGWAEVDGGGVCVVARGLLSIGTPTEEPASSASSPAPAQPAPLGWRHLGWHRIEHGGFDGEERVLRWSGADGETRLPLPEPGRVPQVFRERVAASIAVQEFVALNQQRESGPGVMISGRRDLGRDNAPIEWRATLSAGVDWDTPGIGDLAERATARLRAEYDPAG